MKYIVLYDYQGRGQAEVEADSVEDAEEKFYVGDDCQYHDSGDNYEIRSVELENKGEK